MCVIPQRRYKTQSPLSSQMENRRQPRDSLREAVCARLGWLWRFPSASCSSLAPRVHAADPFSYSRYRAEGRRLQQSLIRSLGFSEHYGRRRSIDRCEIADWKTLPIGDNWSSFGRVAAGKLETIPHLVIGPGAVVNTVCCSRNQETLGNLYVVITNSCNHCEIEHLVSL